MNKENEIENEFKVPLLDIQNLPTVETERRPILKKSTKTNLIAFSPEPKNLKVTFQTPLKTPKVSPGRYESIRHLDEDENWVERTSVLTRQDHTDYLIYAGQILEDLIFSLPIKSDCAKPQYNPVAANPAENQSLGLGEEEQVSVGRNSHFKESGKHKQVTSSSFKSDNNCLVESSPVASLFEETLPVFESPATPLDITEPSQVPTAVHPPVVALSAEKLLSADSPVTSVQLIETSEPVASSVETSKPQKMDGEETEIPIPKGTYKFDFDSMDLENMNPFETKSKMKMGFSPPKETVMPMEESMDTEENPFQTKSKIRSSPPPVAQVEPNPFQSKSKLRNSPPPVDDDNPFQTKSKIASSQPPTRANLDVNNATQKKFTLTPTGSDEEIETGDPLKNLTDINDNDSDKTPFQTATDDSSDLATQEPRKSSPKKKTGPPKKTPTRKSKFSRPAFVNKNNDDGADIVIFEPKKNATQTTAEEIQIFEPKSRLSAERESGNDSENPSAPTSHTSSRSGSNQREIPSSEDEFSNAIPPNQLEPQVGLPSVQNEPEGAKERAPDGSDDFGFDDDGFRPATEVFNDSQAWDMLEKFGSNKDEDKDSLLSRQSLYVKFDPLVESRGKGVESAKPAQKPAINTTVSNVTSSEVSDDLLLMNTPPPSKSLNRLKHPASRLLEQSQAKDRDVDKLFTCSPEGPTDSGCAESASPTRQEPIGSASNDGLVEVLKYSEIEWIELKKQLEMDFQARLLAKERDYDREKKKLQSENKELKANNEKMKGSYSDMQKIVTEYEKTISQVISDKEHVEKNSQTSMGDLVRERNQAVEDLQSMESAFADLLRRNNKLKEAVEAFKKNEETLKKCVTDYQAKIKRHEQRYATLKQHAEDKLQSANEEMEKITKTKNADIVRLQAAQKRSEVQMAGLESSLEQKIKENKELTAICDDLLKQVGGES